MSEPIVASDNQQIEKRELAGTIGNEPPARRLLEIMGRRLIIALATGSVVGATLLCSVGIFYPTLVPSQIGRFFLCLLTAFLFSVFVFTIYPTHYEFNIEKLIKIPFALVGPAALWIALFLLLFYLLPKEGLVGKLFRPPSIREQIPYSTSWTLSCDPTPPAFYKVRITGDQNKEEPINPAGFYVEFDPGHNEYRAIIGIGPSKDEIFQQYDVVFSRSADNYRLEAREMR